MKTKIIFLLVNVKEHKMSKCVLLANLHNIIYSSQESLDVPTF